MNLENFKTRIPSDNTKKDEVVFLDANNAITLIEWRAFQSWFDQNMAELQKYVDNTFGRLTIDGLSAEDHPLNTIDSHRMRRIETVVITTPIATISA